MIWKYRSFEMGKMNEIKNRIRATMYSLFFMVAIITSDAVLGLVSLDGSIVHQMEMPVDQEMEGEDASEDDVKIALVTAQSPYLEGSSDGELRIQKFWLNPVIEQKSPPPELFL